MSLTKETKIYKLYIYLSACQRAAALASEYRNQKDFNFWKQEVLRLYIALEVPINERAEIHY